MQCDCVNNAFVVRSARLHPHFPSVFKCVRRNSCLFSFSLGLSMSVSLTILLYPILSCCCCRTWAFHSQDHPLRVRSLRVHLFSITLPHWQTHSDFRGFNFCLQEAHLCWVSGPLKSVFLISPTLSLTLLPSLYLNPAWHQYLAVEGLTRTLRCQ